MSSDRCRLVEKSTLSLPNNSSSSCIVPAVLPEKRDDVASWVLGGEEIFFRRLESERSPRLYEDNPPSSDLESVLAEPVMRVVGVCSTEGRVDLFFPSSGVGSVYDPHQRQ